jgi:alpha-galactosidase
MTLVHDDVVVLRAAGVSIAFDVHPPVPRILHFGADLGELDGPSRTALRTTATPAVLNNAPDVPRVFSVWPTEGEGWSGTPAQSGHRDGVATTPRPIAEAVELDVPAAGDGGTLRVRMRDELTGTHQQIRFTMSAAGILSVRQSVAGAHEAGLYELAELNALIPLPERATEVLDFTGKWCRERSPQRFPLVDGTHRRDAHRGKPGHDSAFLTVVGTPGFGFRHGEVWAMHVAWSGDQHTIVERLPEGAGALSAVLGGGETLRPGEIRLAPGETYEAPELVFTWSDAGLDAVANRLHRHLRNRPAHPRAPRPLVLNTWEAVYFDHDHDRIAELVDAAARVGVERLVMDDGWFDGRRDANAGLGDWTVDSEVWPDGLGAIVDRVRAAGMQFGLWFEPEMVNLDSRLAREHPDWILAPSAGVGPSARDQYVLDIAHPDAFAYLLERMDALIDEYAIDYIKWDHNRDLLEAVQRSPRDGRPGVHAQTVALYALLDELRRRHPALEIETCSGGGGRIDLGILDHTDRVWASDCNDPVERTSIERWTSLLLPPELIGSHLGSAVSHTTGRSTPLSFRLIAALFAHAGIEWNLTACTPDELDAIGRWAQLYRAKRDLLHTGVVVNADLADTAVSLRGVVSPDGSDALFAWSRVATSSAGQSGRVRFPGLSPARNYEVRVLEGLGAASRHGGDPDWVAAAVAAPVALPGSVLAEAGVPLPTLNPQQAMLIEIRAVA